MGYLRKGSGPESESGMGPDAGMGPGAGTGSLPHHRPHEGRSTTLTRLPRSAQQAASNRALSLAFMLPNETFFSPPEANKCISKTPVLRKLWPGARRRPSLSACLIPLMPLYKDNCAASGFSSENIFNKCHVAPPPRLQTAKRGKQETPYQDLY